MLALRPHSDLLAKESTVSARPVCAPAGLLARPANRSEHKFYFLLQGQSLSVLGLARYKSIINFFIQLTMPFGNVVISSFGSGRTLT